MTKSFGERTHAGNPKVEAARHHYRTRALRRTVRQEWDHMVGWVRWDPRTGEWTTADGQRVRTL